MSEFDRSDGGRGAGRPAGKEHEGSKTMRNRTKVLVAAGLLAMTLVLATVGGTLAQTMPMAADGMHATCQQGAVHEAVAQALGISTDELYAAHAAGKTVAQLAAERGVDLDTVTAAVLQVHKQGLDAQVQAGRLTQEQADANIGVLETRMVSESIDEQRYSRRLAAELLGISALGGVGLAMCGLYGVLSYAVAQRRREFGVRVALGAQGRDIGLMVIAEAVVVTLAGSIVGIPLALLALRIGSHYLLPIPAIDAVTLCLAPLALGTLALAACYLPARRAARADPIEVLRAL